MITTATWRTGVDCGNHGASLFRLEVCDGSVCRPFGPNRQYAAILAGAGYIMPQKMLHEAADRRQATVSRHGRVAALGFDVVQELQYGFGLNVVEIQIGNGFAFVAGQSTKNSFSASR